MSEVSQDRYVELPQHQEPRRTIILTPSLSGHFIYECKGSRPYISRPSRTQQLENPKVLAKLKADGKPSVEVPEEFKSKCVSSQALCCACVLTSRPGVVLQTESSKRRRTNVSRSRTRAKGPRANGDGMSLHWISSHTTPMSTDTAIFPQLEICAVFVRLGLGQR